MEIIDAINPMRVFFALLASGLMFAVAGCSKPEADRSQASPSLTTTPGIGQGSPNAIDACSLLTSDEIEAIQGAALMDAQRSSNSREGLTVSQCYFLLPIAANSVVLTVTQKAEGSDSRDPKQSWEGIFHRDQDKESGREEGEHKSSPEKVTGLGDEAFWMAQHFGGVLYALKGNTYIRISIGGPGDQAAQMQKLKSLAEIILRRL